MPKLERLKWDGSLATLSHTCKLVSCEPSNSICMFEHYPLLVILWNAFWAAAFVGSLYIVPMIYPDIRKKMWDPAYRDETTTIIQRLSLAFGVCILAVFLTPSTWAEMGFPSSILSYPIAALVGLIWTAVLYTGPLYAVFVDKEERDDLAQDWQTLLPWRNVVLAPFLEELMFRSVMVPVMISSGFSFWSTVLYTPLFFGAGKLPPLALN